MDLVDRVSEAFPDEEEIIAATDALQIQRAKLKGTSVQNRWQSIILLIDDENRLDEFINYAATKCGSTSNHSARIRAWTARRAGLLTIGEAAKECRKFIEDIRNARDPREVSNQLVAISGAVKQILSGLADPLTCAELFASLPDTEAAAKPAMAAAYRASSDIDQLLLGLDLAQTVMNRIPSQTTGIDMFSAEFTILGQLLTARARVDESVVELLSQLKRANPGAFDASVS